jgi:hypothetical protein
MKTLFDRAIFDRPHYRLMKQYHPHPTAFCLALNMWFMVFVAIVVGASIGAQYNAR